MGNLLTSHRQLDVLGQAKLFYIFSANDRDEMNQHLKNVVKNEPEFEIKITKDLDNWRRKLETTPWKDAFQKLQTCLKTCENKIKSIKICDVYEIIAPQKKVELKIYAKIFTFLDSNGDNRSCEDIQKAAAFFAIDESASDAVNCAKELFVACHLPVSSNTNLQRKPETNKHNLRARVLNVFKTRRTKPQLKAESLVKEKNDQPSKITNIKIITKPEDLAVPASLDVSQSNTPVLIIDTKTFIETYKDQTYPSEGQKYLNPKEMKTIYTFDPPVPEDKKTNYKIETVVVGKVSDFPPESKKVTVLYAEPPHFIKVDEGITKTFFRQKVSNATLYQMVTVYYKTQPVQQFFHKNCMLNEKGVQAL